MLSNPQFVTVSERGLESSAKRQRLVRAVYRAYREGRQTIALIRTQMREIDTIITGFTEIGIRTTRLTPAAVVSRPARHVRQAFEDGAALVVLPLSGGQYWQEQVVDALSYSLELPAPLCFDGDDASLRDPIAAAPAGGPLRVGLLGCGVVGGALVEALGEHAPGLEVEAVLIRDRARHEVRFPGVRFLTDLDVFRRHRFDVFFDAGSRDAPSEALIRHFLKAGVPVVSANKHAVSGALTELLSLARATGTPFAYSAAVGGSTPVLEWCRRLRERGVRRIEGIVNGTVNYLLDRVAAGEDFARALADAQAAGLAEADPSDDLEGHDAAAKAVLVVEAAFGVVPEGEVPRAGIERGLALLEGRDARRGRVRQLLRVTLDPETGMPQAEVAFARLLDGHPLARCEGAENGLLIETRDGVHHVAHGLGAGPVPTAAAMLADLADVLHAARDRRRTPGALSA